jgi:hypothetical protein
MIGNRANRTRVLARKIFPLGHKAYRTVIIPIGKNTIL